MHLKYHFSHGKKPGLFTIAGGAVGSETTYDMELLGTDSASFFRTYVSYHTSLIMDCKVGTSFKPFTLKGGCYEEKTQNARTAPPRVFGLREADDILHNFR